MLTLLAWPFRLLRALGSAGLAVLLAVSLLVNVATLTMASVNAAVAGVLTAVTGVQTVAGRLRAERRGAAERLDRAERALTRSRAARARGMTRAVASLPAKALPVAGAAAVAAFTAYDLAEACALADAADAPPPPQRHGFDRFCAENAADLEAVRESLAPAMAPLEDSTEPVWEAAAALVRTARAGF